MQIKDLPEHMQHRVKSVKLNEYGSVLEIEFHQLPPVVYQNPKPAFPNPPWPVTGAGSITRPKPGEYTTWNS